MRFAAVLPIALACTTLAAGTAQAQAAARDPNSGKLYCSAKDLFLQESKDGLLDATLYLWNPGDPARIVYPAGAAALLAADAEPFIEIAYSIPFDRTGRPAGRPRPVRISASTGSFAAPPPGPRPTLQIQAGNLLTPPIAINPAVSNWVDPKIVFTLADSPGPSGNQVSQATLDRLVTALEGGDRALLLKQQGKEVARIPIPQRSIIADRDAGIAWFRRTAPLLAAGKCG
jgi:hypothetical protein